MHHVFVETSSSHLLLLYENIRKIGEKTLNRVRKINKIAYLIAETTKHFKVSPKCMIRKNIYLIIIKMCIGRGFDEQQTLV